MALWCVFDLPVPFDSVLKHRIFNTTLYRHCMLPFSLVLFSFVHAWHQPHTHLHHQQPPTSNLPPAPPYQAVALLDGLSGEGGSFWEAYTNRVLPLPSTLSHPVTLPKAMLLELQHSLIIAAAIEQKQRLKTMFPGFSTPMEDEGGPTFMEWAAACVRSRALQVGPQAFALVPFLDVANHDHERPNADFKVDGEHVALVATRRVAIGDEITISYTGQTGYACALSLVPLWIYQSIKHSLFGSLCVYMYMLRGWCCAVLPSCLCVPITYTHTLFFHFSTRHAHAPGAQGNQSAHYGAVRLCA